MRQPSQVERFIAETLGTFLLTLIGGSAATLAALLPHNHHFIATGAELVLVALAHGLALFIIVLIVGRVSGAHVNPAVTLGLASSGQFDWGDVPLYLGAQFLGATIGAACILIVYGKLAATVGGLGAPSLAPNTNLIQGAVIEGIGAGILVLAVISTAADKRSPAGWAGLTIGLALGAIIMAIGPATGAAVNPARAFGPDIIDWIFFRTPTNVDWWAYIVSYLIGPIVGGVAAANLYLYMARLPRVVR